MPSSEPFVVLNRMTSEVSDDNVAIDDATNDPFNGVWGSTQISFIILPAALQFMIGSAIKHVRVCVDTSNVLISSMLNQAKKRTKSKQKTKTNSNAVSWHPTAITKFLKLITSLIAITVSTACGRTIANSTNKITNGHGYRFMFYSAQFFLKKADYPINTIFVRGLFERRWALSWRTRTQILVEHLWAADARHENIYNELAITTTNWINLVQSSCIWCFVQ